MSIYLNLTTGEYPRHEGDIRLDYPEILESQTGDSFPCPSTYAPVAYIDPPSYDLKTQTPYELAPVLNNGAWIMQWAVRDLTEKELKFTDIEANAASW